MLTGSTPFKGKTAEETYYNIKNMKSENLPFKNNFDSTAKDLIQRLLIQDPAQRLGSNNIEELKFHPFFGPICKNWENLRLINVPYVPPHLRRNRPHMQSMISIQTNRNS